MASTAAATAPQDNPEGLLENSGSHSSLDEECRPSEGAVLDRRPIASRRVLRPIPLVRPLILLLHQLVVACRISSVAGVFAIAAPAPTPSSHWHRRRCRASIFANRRRRHCRRPVGAKTILLLH